MDNLLEEKQLIQRAERPIMVVGHLPHLSRLASLLILGTPEIEIVRFTMGGVVCLSESDDKRFVKWVFVPELAHKQK
ncbi:hypothetical protein M1N93_02690 [Dehalococcoidia bacterium]|nr:hypothetical protein [Dehalococcoidia bacterium]